MSRKTYLIGSNGITVVISVLMFSLLSGLLFADTGTEKKTEMKHAREKVTLLILGRMTRHVEWPEGNSVYDPSQPFVFAIYGKNPFGDWLKNTYPRKKIRDKKVVVKFVKKVADIGNPHILFITDVGRKELSRILEYTSNKPILTISNTEGYAKRGVIVNLYVETYDGKRNLDMEINETASHRAGLKLASNLINFAEIIDPYDPYKEKAQQLEVIANEVQWPWSDAAGIEPKTFNIGILGDNPFGTSLTDIYQKTRIHDKQVRLQYYQSVRNVSDVQLLFISSAIRDSLSDVLAYTRKKPILTIGDTDGYARRGVHVNFFYEGLKLKVALNLGSLRDAGLQIADAFVKKNRVVQ